MNKNTDNPYTLLNVDYSSSMDEIKKAYHHLAFIHHPDHGGDAEIFKKISSAYAYLQKTHVQQPRSAASGLMSEFQWYEYDPETAMWWGPKDRDAAGFYAKTHITKQTDAEFDEAVKKKKAYFIGKSTGFNAVRSFKNRFGMK